MNCDKSNCYLASRNTNAYAIYSNNKKKVRNGYGKCLKFKKYHKKYKVHITTSKAGKQERLKFYVQHYSASYNHHKAFLLSKIVLSIYEITLFSNPFWHSLQIEPKKKFQTWKNFFSLHSLVVWASTKLRELPTSVVCASRFPLQPLHNLYKFLFLMLYVRTKRKKLAYVSLSFCSFQQ